MKTLVEKIQQTINSLPQQTQVQYDKQAQIQEVSEKATELGFYMEASTMSEQLAALELLANKMGCYDAADSFRVRLNQIKS